MSKLYTAAGILLTGMTVGCTGVSLGDNANETSAPDVTVELNLCGGDMTVIEGAVGETSR